MKASELRPGRFFELNGVRHLLVGHDEDGLQAAVMQYVYRLVPIDPDTEVNANVPQCWDGNGEPSFYSWHEPTPAQLHDAAMTMNHGIGLRPPAELAKLMNDARQSWRKVFMEPSYLQKQWEQEHAKQPIPPQFKAGDWVVCVDGEGAELPTDILYQVVHVVKFDGWAELVLCENGPGYDAKFFRHATPAEIAEGQG